MLWVPLNVGMSAAHCQGIVGEMSGNFRVSGEWSPCVMCCQKSSAQALSEHKMNVDNLVDSMKDLMQQINAGKVCVIIVCFLFCILLFQKLLIFVVLMIVVDQHKMLC